MDMRITPGPLHGTVSAPPSKSAAHRAVLCAALAEGASRLINVSFSEDIRATLSAARALGAEIQEDEASGSVQIDGCGGRTGRSAKIDCAESGSTLRFLVPIVSALGTETEFSGRGRLPQRPLEPLASEMARHGAVFSGLPGMPFTVSGQLQPGEYRLAGNVSSQFLTGLLYALPLLPGDSRLTLTTPLESAGYVGMTLQALERSGISIFREESGWRIPGGQRYRAADARIEGDWSGAAFWLCAAALGADVRCEGLDQASAQGDRRITSLLEEFHSGGAWEIDASDVPDLVPVLAVTAAGKRGTTRICNAGRLRIKECDRLAAMRDGLERLGGTVREHPDGLEIDGTGSLRGGTVCGYSDHRIVMAFAVASLLCEQPVVISDAQAVSKSYPDFWERFQELGGKMDVL